MGQACCHSTAPQARSRQQTWASQNLSPRENERREKTGEVFVLMAPGGAAVVMMMISTQERDAEGAGGLVVRILQLATSIRLGDMQLLR